MPKGLAVTFGMPSAASPHLPPTPVVCCCPPPPPPHAPQRKRQYTSTSTGFVAAGGERWLLTNAHSVDYHTQVRQTAGERGAVMRSLFGLLCCLHCHLPACTLCAQLLYISNTPSTIALIYTHPPTHTHTHTCPSLPPPPHTPHTRSQVKVEASR
jgi:hypothetical protein